MALLNQRDAYLIHPLEKRVSAQFEAFVRSRPWQSGSITAVEAMKRLDMKKTTFYKLARRLTNK